LDDRWELRGQSSCTPLKNQKGALYTILDFRLGILAGVMVFAMHFQPLV
jgi:hypothetical protein